MVSEGTNMREERQKKSCFSPEVISVKGLQEKGQSALKWSSRVQDSLCNPLLHSGNNLHEVEELHKKQDFIRTDRKLYRLLSLAGLFLQFAGWSIQTTWIWKHLDWMLVCVWTQQKELSCVYWLMQKASVWLLWVSTSWFPPFSP